MPNQPLKRSAPSVLYSPSNPDGWFLETLLEQVVIDIQDKERVLLTEYERGPATEHYLSSNKKISELLTQAAEIQKEAIQFARTNPLTKLTKKANSNAKESA